MTVLFEGGRLDLYQRVTNQIVAAIEKGAGKWEMPWHRAGGPLTKPLNAVSNRPYRGLNVLVLWAAAQTHGYGSRYWATYRQWQGEDCQVKKGEKATCVVFYKQLNNDDDNSEESEIGQRRRLMARAFFLFNAEQVQGWSKPVPQPADPVLRLESAERLVTATAADIRFEGDAALYVPSQDYIGMPERERFVGSRTSTSTEAFYATLLHELVHWSGHPTRLDRDLSTRFGSEAYAVEELVAELGSAFLCAELGISLQPRLDHASYLAHWLSVLKADKRAIFTASGKAWAAASFLFTLAH